MKRSNANTPVNSIVVAKCTKRAAIRKPSIVASALRDSRLSATDLEREGAFGRVGVHRDDVPADQVGPRWQRLQADLHLGRTAWQDPGVAQIDALSRFTRYRHAAERRLEVLGEPQRD